MRRPASGTPALPPALGDFRAVSALRAETMSLMPAQNGFACRGKFCVPRSEPGHHTAEFGKCHISGQVRVALFCGVEKSAQLVRFQPVRFPCRDVESKSPCSVFAPQKYRRISGQFQHIVIHRQSCQGCRVVHVEKRFAPPENHSARSRIQCNCIQRFRVVPDFAGAVQTGAAKGYCFSNTHILTLDFPELLHARFSPGSSKGKCAAPLDIPTHA